MKIEKKVWPENFEAIASGEKTFELRLADFELNEGDELVLKEFDPDTGEYTGKSITKKVNKVRKIDLTKYYDLQDLKKGVYVIEF